MLKTLALTITDGSGGARNDEDERPSGTGGFVALPYPE